MAFAFSIAGGFVSKCFTGAFWPSFSTSQPFRAGTTWVTMRVLRHLSPLHLSFAIFDVVRLGRGRGRARQETLFDLLEDVRAGLVRHLLRHLAGDRHRGLVPGHPDDSPLARGARAAPVEQRPGLPEVRRHCFDVLAPPREAAVDDGSTEDTHRPDTHVLQ